MAGVYLDSSAIVKLATHELESAELRRYLRRRQPHVSSALARTEVLRALAYEGEMGIERGRLVLGHVDLIRLNDRILSSAGTPRPAEIRSLDAIDLATVQQLGGDIRDVVTYDERMVAAATMLGLRTASPT